MMKFLGRNSRGLTIGLGLNRENLDKLVEGKMISVPLAQVGIELPGHILIFFGETEDVMEDKLRENGLITEKTNVRQEGPEKKE